MFPTLALAAVMSLAPAQDGQLAISNARLTSFGEFGPVRTNNKYVPGDKFYVAFDIDNLKMDPAGVVNFSVGMEVTGTSGKIYQQQPVKQAFILPLGGSRVPGRAWMNIDLNTPPGTYTCKLTVTDLEAKTSKAVDKTFEIQPGTFGMVGMFTSADDKGEIPAPLTGYPGQVLYLNFFAVGFGRTPTKDDPKKKEPDLTAELRVYDQSNQPTNAKPAILAYGAGVEERATGLPFQFIIPMNRVGTFTVEVKAECKVTGKTHKVTFPITVLSPPK
jgi:hypothetical protein